MNRSHARLTDWGLRHLSVRPGNAVLDIGCGGGRTIAKLAAMADPGRVCGLDHAEASVAASIRFNGEAIARGQVEVRQGSVSALPWAENTFDVATAVETHFFWPNLAGDMAEVRRVLKPGGTMALIAEVYRGAQTVRGKLIDKYTPQTGMQVLTIEEHRSLFVEAGFTHVGVDTDPQRVWICAWGEKPRE